MKSKAVAGSEKLPDKRSRLIGDVDPEHLKTITVLLKPKRELDLAARRQSNAAPLSREEFAQQYGADPEAVARVESFAAQHHLSVVDANLAQRTVVLRGRTADIQRAFNVDLKLYATQDNTIFTGREGAVYVPEDIEPDIEAVLGIDDRPAARPHFRRMSDMLDDDLAEPRLKLLPDKEGITAHNPRAFTAPEVAKLYNFPTALTGEGQCIGIIELGGGYQTSDLHTYFDGLGIHPGPLVTSVGVLGGANRPGGSSDGEVELDIEVAGAVAPRARIAVYFAPNRDGAFIAAVKTAVHDTIRKPSVITISWGNEENGWTKQARIAFDRTLQEAAAMGVTVLVAAGDLGSSDEGPPGAQPHVDFPSSSPFALACGGTKLLTSDGTTIASEVVWNEGSRGGAGGGGVSIYFDKPAYQNNVNVPLSPSGTVGRGLPDVSGNADPRTGYKVVIDGKQEAIGGTSAVAPLYAGLIALINEARAKVGLPWVGLVNDDLYSSAGVCRDITEGNNDMYGNLNGLYTAGAGWDAASGLGSADGARWLAALLPLPKPKTIEPVVQPQPQA